MTEAARDSGTTAASVVIPTIGRPQLLRACLESLAGCEPRASEIVVVDQSGGREIQSLASGFHDLGAVVLTDNGRGRGRAVNTGLRAATHDLVLVTDDDCTVAPDWVGVGARLMAQGPGGIVTGRVLPLGNSRLVPSTKIDPEPFDYTGVRAHSVLFAGNMACSRSALLDFGGFDERIVPAAEDNDLCHRWLKDGRSLRYEPELTVWHRDWRTPQQLRQHYRRYARGEGVFYAKRLREGDLTTLRYVSRDLRGALRGQVVALLRGKRDWSDPRLGVLPALPLGLVEGWRTCGPRMGSS